ncbi:hypothetical protein [Rhodocyclus tenuis]|uniref:Uncharacterized protein n=1 Tax=Rhodocyclus tenuis TaxID=1066 RepID=A0A840G0Z0_RHOTE|nr:hypothetical protein [Rhodocyclus tenuis]MBB4246133.1 hypothetical protein [Rhodocyclus tenuis]
MSIQNISSTAIREITGNAARLMRQDPATSPAKHADNVTLSAAGLRALSSEQEAGVSGAGGKVSLDTNQGVVNQDIESFLVDNKAKSNGELPPLLMPSQRNIDALSGYLSAKFPGFLSANGIPYAPEQITYDSAGQVQFPADYPYAKELKQALQESPVMANALSWSVGLSQSKALLDEGVRFQQEYLNASPQQLGAVLARHAQLLSGNAPAPQAAISFSPTGEVRLTVDGKPQSA